MKTVSPIFDDFLAAVDAEFGFLSREFGFEKFPPEQFGRECSVGYAIPNRASIEVSGEPNNQPLVSLSLWGKHELLIVANRPLRSLAAVRSPDWLVPSDLDMANPEDIKLYLRSNADLLREHFLDVLQVNSSKRSYDVWYPGKLFEDTLYALALLLKAARVDKRWQKQLHADIVAWVTKRNAAKHCDRYSGKSSYLEWRVDLDTANGLNERQVVWANVLLRKLQYLGQFLAEDPTSAPHQRKHWDISIEPRSPVVSALKCAQCGTTWVSDLALEVTLAEMLLVDLMEDAFQSGTLTDLTDIVKTIEMDEIAAKRQTLTATAQAAGLTCYHPTDRSTNCRRCNSQDTTVTSVDLAAKSPLGAAGSSQSVKRVRLWGLAITLTAFFGMVILLRSLTIFGTPEATGSVMSNLGILLLLSLPWVVLVAGFIQLISGVDIRNYNTNFQSLPLLQRIGIGLVSISVALGASVLAFWLA